MDLTRLNPFLEIAEHTRIESGQAEGVEFDAQIHAGRATGSVRPVYRDLDIALLDEKSGSAKSVVKRTETLLTNVLKIRNNNLPDKSGEVKPARINYERKPEDTFIQVLWFSVRSGVRESIGL
jgi:hypothetical protein